MKLSLALLALAFLAPCADAGCGKLAKFNPFKARKERRAAESLVNLPLGPPAASVAVAAPAATVPAAAGVVLTYGAPFCANGKCSVKVRVR